MTGGNLISAHGVGMRLGGHEVLNGVDVDVRAGEIVTLIGPNGAGKTTLVRILLGLLAPHSGSVWRAADLRVGYMPQRLELSPNLPLSVARFLKLSGDTSDAQLRDIAVELGISTLLEQPIRSLSGGEHQRVLLARAVARQPRLLVLDEPVQGVDVGGQAQLYGRISQIRDRLGCGVLMISHDLHLVMAATDRVLCINRHVCCAGNPESVTRHPAYLELFGAPEAARLAVYTHHHNHRHDLHGDVVTEPDET